MTKQHLTQQKFTDFDLHHSLVAGVADAGFEYCTPIQAASLPPALQGRDVAGQAQTGTGKTVAFLLAGCHHLLTRDADADTAPRAGCRPRALILAPTRELAIQIYHDAEVLAKHTGLSLALIYGGTGYEEQKQMLQRGADILIGTPGRLIDYYKQHLYDLTRIQVMVMDEADRMFDLGFIRDIRYLLRKMPPPERRLNLLFSATLSFRVMEIAYEHMNDPEEIKIDADMRIADKIRELCYYPANEEKRPLLVNLLKDSDGERALIFVNTRIAAENIANTLSANGISNAALSGEVPQKKREALLQTFKDGGIRALVATDVAARGLHIPAVSHVYNYDLPQDAEDYVHRIGRTARAGASGEAISFICERYAYSIMDIEQFIGHPIPRAPVAPEHLRPIELGKAASGGRGMRQPRAPRERRRPAAAREVRQEPSHKPIQEPIQRPAPRASAPPSSSRKFGEVPLIG